MEQILEAFERRQTQVTSTTASSGMNNGLRDVKCTEDRLEDREEKVDQKNQQVWSC